MRWVSLIKNVLVFLFVSTVIFWVGNKVVFGDYIIPALPGVDPFYTSGGYTEQQILDGYCEGSITFCPKSGTASDPGSYAPGQKYSGFYEAPNGNFYPIGVPVVVYDNPGSPLA